MFNFLLKFPVYGFFFLFSAALFAAGQTVSERHAYVAKNTGNPYFERNFDGFSEAVKELGAEAIAQAPAQSTVEGQVQVIEQLIAQKVASITISGNDPDALQPVLTKALNQGIKVISSDAAVNAASRIFHVNQADSEQIGRLEVQAITQMIGGEGEIGILSATTQASNQNLWISWMQEELKDPAYAKVKLVKTVYGPDYEKSVTETEALLQAFPNLKGIISPTSIGIAAAGKVISDKGLIGKVQLTGLGLPSEMEEYILNGACQWMYLWNPIDLGYLSGYAAVALARGEITGKEGEVLSAGRLGEKKIVKATDGGLDLLLGPPFRFDKDNIEEWAKIF